MHMQIKVMYRLSMLFKDKLMMQIFQSTTTFPVNPDVEGLSVDKAETFLFFLQIKRFLSLVPVRLAVSRY